MNQQRMLNFTDLGFEITKTRDGSPTLNLMKNAETMHHSGGAASETWYIYGTPMTTSLKLFSERKPQTTWKIATVGLGLGYIEMALALNLATFPEMKRFLRVDSFEIVPELKTWFFHWFSGNKDSETSTYNEVCRHLIEKSIIPIKKEIMDVQEVLCALWDQSFFLHDDFRNFKNHQRWNMICFDAFSKKTSEELWTSAFLDQVVKNSCAEDCVFTTYACTGQLKKVLENNDFILLSRPGFSGKRESTLALRGLFKSESKLFQTF